MSCAETVVSLRYARQLDHRAFQQLYPAAASSGSALGSAGCGPGCSPAGPGSPSAARRMRAAAPAQSAGQPHRVYFVRFGPAGQALGLGGVDQLHRQPACLQHEEPDPPVVAVDSRVTISMPSCFSWRPSLRIAFSRAFTVQTRLCRVPGRDGCGSRVHTTPESFATSIAAARSWTRSCSSSSITCGLLTAASYAWADGIPAGCPGVPVGGRSGRNTDRRARGNRARPSGQDPSARLRNGFASQEAPASRAARTHPATPRARTAAPTPARRRQRPQPETTCTGQRFSRRGDHPPGGAMA